MLRKRSNYERRSLHLEWTGIGNEEIINIAEDALKINVNVTELNFLTYLEVSGFLIPVVISDDTDRHSLIVSSITGRDIADAFRDAASNVGDDIDDIRDEFNYMMDEDYETTEDYSVSLDISEDDKRNKIERQIENSVERILTRLVSSIRKDLRNLEMSVTECNRMMDSRRRYEEDDDDDSVIVKVGNKWRIKGNKIKYWNAEYDTKAKALSALRAYHANRH